MCDDLLDRFLTIANEEVTNPDSFGAALTSINEASNVASTSASNSKQKAVLHSGDTDSSDDEDNRDFQNSKYNEFGRDVKHMLEDNKSTSNQLAPSTKYSTWKTKTATVTPTTLRSEPIFGIRVVNPLVSSQLLEERLVGRKVVSFMELKMYARTASEKSDWVISGVMVQKSPTKTSQNGKSYCMWTLSDLKNDCKTATIFLFGNAYKELWKTTLGTVVGILNPSVMELREGSKDEACLSVYNHQRVLIIGQSKDMGTCKSLKKNGDRCTSFVNTSVCEFCLYHVKQEYQKASKRTDIQSAFSGGGLTALRNKVLGKDQVFYAGKLYTSLPSKKNKKQIAKDDKRIQALSSDIFKGPTNVVKKPKLGAASQHDLSHAQRLKDLERLKQLGLEASSSSNKKNDFPAPTSQDVTLEGSKNLAANLMSKLKEQKSAPSPTPEVPNQRISTDLGKTLPLLNLQRNWTEIDLSISYRKKQVVAKSKAVAWVQNNGPITKTNPNSVRSAENGKKRTSDVLATLSSTPATKKLKVADPKIQENEFFSERFKKLMAATSAHVDLLEQRDNEEQDKYFNKLEKKEQMEEKMMNTFKMPCKAVRCLKCKYTNFSAADHCKAEKHPLRVFDTQKRFFKCGNCNNRTVSLTIVPLDPCKNCNAVKWVKTSMMKENMVQIGAPKLSIRGGEQIFTNSNVADGNLNLMVPEG